MSYLAKLKQLEGDKNFNNTPLDELPKPTKPPFVSFGSTDTANIEKNIYDISGLNARRQKVSNILADNPHSQRAIISDLVSDPNNVLLTIAIRDMATFEMALPRVKYDAFLILDLIEKAQIQ